MEGSNNSNHPRCIVIGVTGGTGSGKTTIAKSLLSRLNQNKRFAEMLTMDSYYKELENMTFEERAQTNFDHPAAFQTELLVNHVKELRAGNPVNVPTYSFETHQRTSEVTCISAPKILILEGILLFVDPKLRELIDVKVFVDAPSDVRFIRRLKRDVIERGRSVEQICSQYMDTVRVMHNEFVEPSKVHADVIVPNLIEGDYDVIVDLLASRALANGINNNHKRVRI